MIMLACMHCVHTCVGMRVVYGACVCAALMWCCGDVEAFERCV